MRRLRRDAVSNRAGNDDMPCKGGKDVLYDGVGGDHGHATSRFSCYGALCFFSRVSADLHLKAYAVIRVVFPGCWRAFADN